MDIKKYQAFVRNNLKQRAIVELNLLNFIKKLTLKQTVVTNLKIEVLIRTRQQEIRLRIASINFEKEKQE